MLNPGGRDILSFALSVALSWLSPQQYVRAILSIQQDDPSDVRAGSPVGEMFPHQTSRAISIEGIAISLGRSILSLRDVVSSRPLPIILTLEITRSALFGERPSRGIVDPLLDAHAVDFRGAIESLGGLETVALSTANVGALDVGAERADLSPTVDFPFTHPVFAISVACCEEERADLSTPLALAAVCKSVSDGLGDIDLFLDAALEGAKR